MDVLTRVREFCIVVCNAVPSANANQDACDHLGARVAVIQAALGELPCDGSPLEAVRPAAATLLATLTSAKELLLDHRTFSASRLILSSGSVHARFTELHERLTQNERDLGFKQQAVQPLDVAALLSVTRTDHEELLRLVMDDAGATVDPHAMATRLQAIVTQLLSPPPPVANLSARGTAGSVAD
jgi:hypothetical protein